MGVCIWRRPSHPCRDIYITGHSAKTNNMAFLTRAVNWFDMTSEFVLDLAFWLLFGL